MASHKCAFNSATALRRVFIPSNLNASDGLHVTRIFVPALLPYPAQQTRTFASFWDTASQRKPGGWGSNSTQSTSASERAAIYRPNKYGSPPPSRYSRDSSKPKFEARPPPRPPRTRVKLARLPRDDEIRDRWVVLSEMVDGQERLSERLFLTDVLPKVDRKTHSLQVIRAPDPDDPEAPKDPICRIINKKEELERQRKEKELKKQTAAPKEKELDINWAMAENDLKNKLRRLQDFLRKGYKVTVVLAPKSRAKTKLSEKDAQTVLQKVLDATTEVTGSKEWRAKEGKLLGNMRLFLQGKVQEKAPETNEI